MARPLPITLLCTLIASQFALSGPPVPTPTPYSFPPREHVAGTRYAVLEDGGNLRHSGDVRVTFQKSGAFSAQVRLGRWVKRFAGRTNLNADWPPDYVPRPFMLSGTPVELTFGWLNRGNGLEYFCGVSSLSGIFSSSGLLKAVAPAKAVRALNGRFTSLIGGGSTPFPTSGGFAAVLSTGNTVRASGYLPNGRVFSFSAPILEDWSWSALKAGDPVSGTWILAAAFGSEDAFAGQFKWELPSAANPQDAPPQQTPPVSGARRNPNPTMGFPGVAGAWLADVFVGGANSVSAVGFTLPVGKGPVKFLPEYDGVTAASFSLNRISGLFSGSFRSGGKAFAYRGVVYDPSNIGLGLVITRDSVRPVELVPLAFPQSGNTGSSGTTTLSGGGLWLGSGNHYGGGVTLKLGSLWPLEGSTLVNGSGTVMIWRNGAWELFQPGQFGGGGSAGGQGMPLPPPPAPPEP